MKHLSADENYLKLALKLARKGRGRTSPNPMVGALVVKEDKIVGKGFHPAAGKPHAEIFALREAGEQARQATMYVTLEPCNHHGRTPPCTEAIIAAGISRVVIGMEDPNPKVAGKGIAR
ncbi:MAG: bifunctional diaminohydroxyphosphoribosylaminopyrimidine deaminase/5-amino-6-(5-phosphoribosylamino)uracil reductase RibD, partial [Pseudomonadota bacterium]|nr:bifunctional diaminohydroxyphosphoribosylaminopyrimidine deaminase/5-amino-6-(5-phosphoribosylamino)uracil reductase RibD [Pseudomonadota bacterium]